MREFVKDHSLTLVLLVMLAIMVAASWPVGEASYNPADHPYWKYWLAETIFSLEADVFGGLILVWFTKFLIERGSKESKQEPSEEE